jgi:hypothetical protein
MAGGVWPGFSEAEERERGRARRAEQWEGKACGTVGGRATVGGESLQRRVRLPEDARLESGNCKMQMQMQHPLELLQCLFSFHFADAACFGVPARDSLSTL